MALVVTTLSAAVAVNDRSIVVASATSVAAGRLVRVDGEMMQVSKEYVSGTTVPVLRGVDGSTTATHKASANVVHGLASDFASPPAGLELGQIYPATPAFPVFSYSASGAMNAVQGIHIFNGTGALTMTLANPDASQDGQIMIIVANGKAAHTLTYAAGLGNGGSSFDVGTFSASLAGGCILIAANGFWCCVGNGLLNATSPVGAPTWA